MISFWASSQRLSSTTTRIKTFCRTAHCSRNRHGQRLSSTTTRIKTYTTRSYTHDGASQRLSSTTTRIKTCTWHWARYQGTRVRDYLPLQQGLRPCHFGSDRLVNCFVRDYLPLQQGLRRFIHLYKSVKGVFGQRLSSTTTRIKTPLSRELAHSFEGQRLSSTTTRIKTPQTFWNQQLPRTSETIFHYNKD